MARTVISTWYETLLVDGREVVRSRPAPDSVEELAARIRVRQLGNLTPEETELLATRGSDPWSTRDRRLADHGLQWDPRLPATPPHGVERRDRDRHRSAILAAAEVALAASWDPSVHVEEAVRAASDLDRAANLVGERLASWASRDAPELDSGDPEAAARRVLEDAPENAFGPVDPAVRDARRRLADLYRAIEITRAELTNAVKGAVPERTPNLSALLGPDLAARLLAQARGLDRLARLPSSTVQVLGAEKAFFEHLRGHAPPPRHGLLFLHPAIQSASRLERGKLARTLAGKVAIAARLDRAGAPLDPALLRAFEARRAQVKASRSKRGPEGRRRSGKPLHAATRDG